MLPQKAYIYKAEKKKIKNSKDENLEDEDWGSLDK